MIKFVTASQADFDTAYEFIEALWTYNTYDKEKVKKVYEEVIQDKNSFVFFLYDDGECKGFCHGDYFNTFWISGMTCYISSLIVKENVRNMGYGKALLDEALKMARKNNCRAVILNSGISRTGAHKFYEKYGFKKSCFGFGLIL